MKTINQLWGNSDEAYGETAVFTKGDEQECMEYVPYTFTEFERKMLYSVWNNSVKGLYGLDDPNPIDQQCLGDWMEADFKVIEDLGVRFAATGSQDVTYEESIQGAVMLVDLYYNANYQCQYENIMFDMIYYS